MAFPSGWLPARWKEPEYRHEQCCQVRLNSGRTAADPQNAKPAGEWNSVEIKVYKGSVWHYQNGEVVVEYHLWTPEWNEMVAGSKFPALNEDWADVASKGYFGLQDHGMMSGSGISRSRSFNKQIHNNRALAILSGFFARHCGLHKAMQDYHPIGLGSCYLIF